MLNSKSVKEIIDFIKYLLITINAIIVFRLITLSLNIDIFRDSITGRLSKFGYEVKIFQIVIDGLTIPLINPFKTLAGFATDDKKLIEIVAPLILILLSFILIMILTITSPHIIRYMKNKEDDYWGFYN